MSIWTRICGSVMLEKEPDDFKLGKKGEIIYDEDGWAKKTLPFPEEQISVTWLAPRKFKEDEIGWEITISRSSLPIIKNAIEKLIKDFPSGEREEIFHSLVPDDSARSSSGGGEIERCFPVKKEREIAKRKFLEKINAFTDDWKRYTKLYPVKLFAVDNIEDSILTIHDDVRWCKSEEMYAAVIKFFKELVKTGIIPIEGHLTVSDDCFQFGTKRYDIDIDSDRIVTRISDKETGPKLYEVYQFCAWWGKSKDDPDGDRFPFVYRFLKMSSYGPESENGSLYKDYDTLESLLEAEKEEEEGRKEVAEE